MTMSLSPAHLQLLTDASGIDPAVVVERGYSTCDDLAALLQYWVVPMPGVSLPGLLIPLHSTTGGPATYRHPTSGATIPYVVYRPDVPMLDRQGRPRKYVNPPRTGVRLDCPPRVQPVLGDPTQPLWITEGSKKTDALVSHGAHALGLLGVTCWRGRNSLQGKVALPDWFHIALNGREIRIVFDSDVATNPAVERELRTFVTWLQSRDALVHIAYLPSPAAGKCAVDDYLLTHTLTQLEGLLEAPRPQARGSRQPVDPTETRPVITVDTDVVPVVDALEAAMLAQPGTPRIYQWHRLLAVIAHDTHPPKWLRDTAGTTVIHDATLDHLYEEASRAAQFSRWDVRANAEVRCLPPVWAVRALRARSTWRLPHLAGMVTAPTILSDGRIVDQPGYDPASGLYLAFPSGVFPSVPDAVTRDEALAALQRLKTPFAEFAFVADYHRSTALGALFELTARDLIQGSTPAYGVTATTPGAGKGLLIDTITTIATGAPAAKWSNITDDGELDKRFLAVAISGRRVVCIDNIARPFGNEIIDAAVTAGVVGGRILGTTNDTVVPFRATLFLSGNNLAYVGDMLRRVLPIALDPGVEHPEDLAFKIPDLLSWVQTHRPHLVMDTLTILKAFLTAPEADTRSYQEPWGSFDGWSRTIRACLRWLGEADPLDGRKELREQADPQLETLGVLLLAWDACFGRATLTLREVVTQCRDNLDKEPWDTTKEPSAFQQLADALAAYDRRADTHHLDPKRLGNALRKWKGRIVHGLRLVEVGKDRNGVGLWRVEPPPAPRRPAPPTSAGSAWTAGSVQLDSNELSEKTANAHAKISDSSPKSSAGNPAHHANPARGTDHREPTLFPDLTVASPTPVESAVLRPDVPCHVWHSAPTYLYVTTTSQLVGILPQLLAQRRLGLDTETTGLDWQRDRLRLVQLATPELVVIIDAFACPLAPLIPLLRSATEFVAHNAKFDLHILGAAGLPWPANLCDTQVLAQLLGARGGKKQPRYRLEDVVARTLGESLDKSHQKDDWSGELSTAQLHYAATDAAIMLPLAEALSNQITATDLTQIAMIEQACVPAMAWMEEPGMPLEVEPWLALAADAPGQVTAIEAALNALVQESGYTKPIPYTKTGKVPKHHDPMINWHSWHQVLPVLHARGHQVDSTAREALEMLRTDDPVVTYYLERLEWVERAKRGAEWVEKYVRDGRVSAQFHQLGSSAGRMSCSDPNLQNIPRTKAYRQCFRAPEGLCLLKADYGQIELRIAAVLAQEQRMLDAFRRGEDLHRKTAAQVYNIKPADVTPAARQIAKTVNFGLIYGLGAESLRSKVWSEAHIDISLGEAETFRRTFFQMYPAFAQWHATLKRQIRTQGSLETRTLANRRRLDIRSYTEAANTPTQGSAADGFKLALVHLWQDHHTMPDARVIGLVHDEMILEVPTVQAYAASAWVKRHMEDAMTRLVRGQVPIQADVSIGQDWAGTPLAEGG
jgi:DNA polymerase-1